jgi:CheY-like chemotaxis protein
MGPRTPNRGGQHPALDSIATEDGFGAAIKAARNLLGISQKVLAERSQLSPAQVSEVERGARNPSLKSIVKLARALEDSIDTWSPAEFQNGTSNKAAEPRQDKNLIDILLVENDTRVVHQALAAFKKAQFRSRIHVVPDGAKALACLSGRGKYFHRFPAGSPHVMLLDLSLPNVSGMEVLRAIQGDHRTAQIYIVVLVGGDDDHYLAEFQRLGADDYVVKPVNFRQLSQSISKLNFNPTAPLPPRAAPPDPVSAPARWRESATAPQCFMRI